MKTIITALTVAALTGCAVPGTDAYQDALLEYHHETLKRDERAMARYWERHPEEAAKHAAAVKDMEDRMARATERARQQQAEREAGK